MFCYDESMKKRIVCAGFALALCACQSAAVSETVSETVNAPAAEENGMKIAIDTQYGGFALRFEAPENTYETEITLCKEDGSSFEISPLISESGGYYNLYDLCAYVASSNEWYDTMRVSAKAKNAAKEVIAEALSEPFSVKDYFVEEETRTVSARQPRIFSYAAESHMYMPEYQNEMTHCTIVFDDDEVTLSGVYYGSSGRRKEIESTLSKEETDQLLQYIEAGQLVRKRVRDPSFIILDESTPASFHLTLADGDRLEDRWYDFSIEKSRQDELLAFLTELCAKRA